MTAPPEVMTSNRPYLLRALYEWISDNALTPHILVDASFKDVVVPEQAVQQGKVVLNVSASATTQLELGNEYIQFNARFTGQPHRIVIPMNAVIAIYARENGQGMMFAQEDEPPPPVDDPDSTAGRSHLKVVK